MYKHNTYAHFSPSDILDTLCILCSEGYNFVTQEISCLFGYRLICGVHKPLVQIKVYISWQLFIKK